MQYIKAEEFMENITKGLAHRCLMYKWISQIWYGYIYRIENHIKQLKTDSQMKFIWVFKTRARAHYIGEITPSSLFSIDSYYIHIYVYVLCTVYRTSYKPKHKSRIVYIFIVFHRIMFDIHQTYRLKGICCDSNEKHLYDQYGIPIAFESLLVYHRVCLQQSVERCD